MLDLKKCPGCGSNTSYSASTCPYCGYRFDNGTDEEASQSDAAYHQRCPNCHTPLSENHPVCPACKTPLKAKSRSGSYLLIGGFIAAVILLAVFVFHVPGGISAPWYSSQVMAVVSSPTVPVCNIEIAGSKQPTGTIQLQLMAITCGPNDVTDLQVLVNSKNVGKLPYRLGSIGTFPGQKGLDGRCYCIFQKRG